MPPPPLHLRHNPSYSALSSPTPPVSSPATPAPETQALHKLTRDDGSHVTPKPWPSHHRAPSSSPAVGIALSLAVILVLRPAVYPPGQLGPLALAAGAVNLAMVVAPIVGFTDVWLTSGNYLVFPPLWSVVSLAVGEGRRAGVFKAVRGVHVSLLLLLVAWAGVKFVKRRVGLGVGVGR